MKIHIIDDEIIINGIPANIEVSDARLSKSDKNKLFSILENIQKQSIASDPLLDEYIKKYNELNPKRQKSEQINETLFDFEIENNFDSVVLENLKENFNNITNELTQGENSEREDRYANGNEQTERENEKQGDRILRQISAQSYESATGQLETNECKDTRIYSTKSLQQQSKSNRREEIEYYSIDVNFGQNVNSNIQSSANIARENNEEAQTKTRAITEEERDIKQNQFADRQKQDFSYAITQKEIDELLEAIFQNDDEISKLDNESFADINSKEFLFDLQEKCLDLSLKLMDEKTLEVLSKTHKFNDLFYDRNFIFKAEQANYDITQFNQKAQEFFGFYFALAASNNQLSKFDLPFTNMVAKMLLDMASRLPNDKGKLKVLNDDLQDSVDNLQKLVEQIKNYKIEQDTKEYSEDDLIHKKGKRKW